MSAYDEHGTTYKGMIDVSNDGLRNLAERYHTSLEKLDLLEDKLKQIHKLSNDFLLTDHDSLINKIRNLSK